MKVAKRKIYIGWNEQGVFDWDIGSEVRLNDLAMFSLYLARMALGESGNTMVNEKVKK